MFLQIHTYRGGFWMERGAGEVPFTMEQVREQMARETLQYVDRYTVDGKVIGYAKPGLRQLRKNCPAEMRAELLPAKGAK